MSTSLTLVITFESDTWHHKILAVQPITMADVENAATSLVGASATGCVIKYLDQGHRCLCTLDHSTLKNLPFVNNAVWHIFLFRDNETALFVPPVAELATDEIVSKATPQEAALLRKNFESANSNNNDDDGNHSNNNNNNNTPITNNVQAAPAAPAAPEERRKRIERLVFGVARVLRRFSYISAKPVTTTATVYLSAVVEYLCAEVLELAGTAATASGSARILPRHIASAVENDEELKGFFDSNNHSDLWYRSMFYGMFDYTSAEATFPASRVYRVLKQVMMLLNRLYCDEFSYSLYDEPDTPWHGDLTARNDRHGEPFTLGRLRAIGSCRRAFVGRHH